MRVGIVIPAHDVASCIGACIASVIAQSHQDWALRIVDDGSADGTAAAAGRFEDARVRVVRQVNAGVSAARNAGLALLPPVDAVLFLDADDWLAPDALARLVAALRSGAVAACGGYVIVSEAGAVRALRRRPVGRGGDVLSRLLERNLFANPGHVLLRAQAVQRAGGFRTDLRFGEDWEFMVRIALQGPIVRAAGPPVLRVRARAAGATRGMASDATMHAPCEAAVFGNPQLALRFGQAGLARLRARYRAERDWVLGRELIRHGSRSAGLRLLRAAWAAKPRAKRVLLLAAATLQPMLPPRWQGPFRAYAD